MGRARGAKEEKHCYQGLVTAESHSNQGLEEQKWNFSVTQSLQAYP